jgi:hypothetical protein
MQKIQKTHINVHLSSSLSDQKTKKKHRSQQNKHNEQSIIRNFIQSINNRQSKKITILILKNRVFQLISRDLSCTNCNVNFKPVVAVHKRSSYTSSPALIFQGRSVLRLQWLSSYRDKITTLRISLVMRLSTDHQHYNKLWTLRCDCRNFCCPVLARCDQKQQNSLELINCPFVWWCQNPQST